MPPKKKKSFSNAAEVLDGLADVFRYLDEVQECLDRARTSEVRCVQGVRKADEALRQCCDDLEIQCSIRMKRAQLLFIVVEKNYHTGRLPPHHTKPLESCILDCEKVLTTLSEESLATRIIYQEAESLAAKARRLCTGGDGHDVRSRKTQNAFESVENAFETVENSKRNPRYDPTKTVFREISKINPLLLQDVVNCYKKSKKVCRFCFFRNRKQERVGHNRYCRQCKRVSPTVLVMPASRMCKNFANMKIIPISQPPKVMMADSRKHKPFLYCNKDCDHNACLEKSATGDIWFAHFIEELVIWTVERHYHCRFGAYIERYHSPITMTTNQSSTVRAGDLDEFDSFSEGTTGTEDEYDFYPDDVVFECMASIPLKLLKDIIDCYEQVKEYCQWCFYKQRKNGVATLSPSNGVVCSICKRAWESVYVIPASDLCWNFGDFEEIPLAPWPKSKPNSDPFEYCLKDDHFRCFRVYIDSEFWYAHTVEELVIWTVERECDCSFSHYVSKVKKPPPELQPKQEGPFVPADLAGTTWGESSPAGYLSPAHSGPSSVYLSPAHSISSLSSHTHSSSTHSSSNDHVEPTVPEHYEFIVFKLSEIKFKKVADIPYLLLEDIAHCFLRRLDVCRKCFYGERQLSSIVPEENRCSLAQHEWLSPVLVIPGCTLCNNEPCFHPGEYVAIPPLPPVGRLKRCELTNHHKCFSNSLDSNGWFAHSVEELVIWLVESEKECSFLDFVVRVLNVEPLIPERQLHPKLTANKPQIPASTGQRPPPSSSVSSQASKSFSSAAKSKPTAVPTTAKNSTSTQANKSKEKYDPRVLSFTSVSDVPEELLSAVAACFKQRLLICRICFFESHCKILSSKKETRNTCEKGHPWRQITVIPQCKLCISPRPFIPIPPVPKHMNHSKSPFVVCKKENHATCYNMSKTTNPWFPHTVEELVIWTVERDEGPFELVYEIYLSGEAANPTSLPVTEGRLTFPPSVINQEDILPDLNLPSIDTLDLTRPQDREPPKSLPPSEFALPVPVLGFEDALALASKGMAASSNVAKPPLGINTTLSHAEPLLGANRNSNSVNPPPGMDLTSNLAAEYLLGADVKANAENGFYFSAHRYMLSDYTGSQPDPLGLQPSFGDLHGPPFPGIPMGNASQGITADDAMEYFPALFGDAASTVAVAGASQSPQESELSAIGAQLGGGRVIGGQLLQSAISQNVQQEANIADSALNLFATPSTTQPVGFAGGAIDSERFGSESSTNFTKMEHALPVSMGLQPPGPFKQAQATGIIPGEILLTSAQIAMTTTNESNQNAENWPEISEPLLLELNGPVDENEGNAETLLTSKMSVSRPAEAIYSSPARASPLGPAQMKQIVSRDTETENYISDTHSSISAQLEQLVPEGVRMESYVPVTNGSAETVRASQFIPSSAVTESSKQPSSNPGMTALVSQQIQPEYERDPRMITHWGQQLAGGIKQKGFAGNNPNLAVQVGPGIEQQDVTPYRSDPDVVMQLGPGIKQDDFIPVHSNSDMALQLEQSALKQESPILVGSQNYPERAVHFTELIPQECEPESSSPLDSTTFSVEDAEDTETPEVYKCFLCYESFDSAEQFAKHTKSDTHEATMKEDCGGKLIWKHLPPPPGRYPIEFAICANPEMCPDRLSCQKAHYTDELSEWRQRYQHRKFRRQTQQLDVLPHFAMQEPGPVIHPCLDNSQYQAVKVSVSIPVQASVALGDVSWRITLQGANWQSLFGIWCKSHAPVHFRIMRIEGDTFYTIQPKSTVWEAHTPIQALLLGRVTIIIKATPTSPPCVGSFSCQVCFNLGFYQYLHLSLDLTVEGSEPSLPPPQSLPVEVEGGVVEGIPWQISSGSSEGELGLEAEDYTLQHYVPIEDQAYSLTDENGMLFTSAYHNPNY